MSLEIRFEGLLERRKKDGAAGLKYFVDHNCPYHEYFCDGTPMSGKLKKIKPCSFYALGMCVNSKNPKNTRDKLKKFEIAKREFEMAKNRKIKFY